MNGENEMRFVRICLMLSALVFAGGLAGCGGGSAEVKSTTRTSTLGQELMDLDKAYQQGAITEEQYKKAKETLLKNQK